LVVSFRRTPVEDMLYAGMWLRVYVGSEVGVVADNSSSRRLPESPFDVGEPSSALSRSNKVRTICCSIQIYRFLGLRNARRMCQHGVLGEWQFSKAFVQADLE
jgi:hypothetical protein